MTPPLARHKFRLGYLAFRSAVVPTSTIFAAIGDHAAVRQVADALRIPGDDLAVYQ